MRVSSPPSVRLIQLYALLASGGRPYSLGRLADVFGCSRQTILRMMEQLELVDGFKIEQWREGRENMYRVKARQSIPALRLNEDALRHLLLCRDIVRHVLPKPLQEEIEVTIGAATVLLGSNGHSRAALESGAESFGKGTIDYTPFQDYLDAVQSAMHGKRLCRVRYLSRHGAHPKSYIVAPVSILAFREALYLHCVVCIPAGAPAEQNSRTFAIHRIRGLEILEQRFGKLPEVEESGAFGFRYHKPIQVRVAFSTQAADYVRERTWSADQRIRNRKGGGILLTFTTTSRQEALAWVLSFGSDAELLEPKELREEIREVAKEMAGIYG